VLEQRVSAAAHNVCEEAGIHPLPVQLAQKRCFTTAQASGREQLARVVDSRRAGAALAGASIIVRASH
jgi:UrcA family protein